MSTKADDIRTMLLEELQHTADITSILKDIQERADATKQQVYAISRTLFFLEEGQKLRSYFETEIKVRNQRHNWCKVCGNPADFMYNYCSLVCKLIDNTIENPATGCHLWTGPTNPDTGYAWARMESKSRAVHRYVFSVYNPEVELNSSIVVRHLCNDPRCVNPEHLVAGSFKDNMADRDLRYSTGAVRKLDELSDDDIDYLLNSPQEPRVKAAYLNVSEQGVLAYLKYNKKAYG